MRATKPHILLVAMSSPRKEYWLAEHAADLGVPFSMGVGGSIDVAAGLTKRAPAWMQRTGLEWFYRLAQEPQPAGTALPQDEPPLRRPARPRARVGSTTPAVNAATDLPRRTVALPYLSASDTLRSFGASPNGAGVRDGALDAAVRWLCLSHDVTERRGSSKGFSLLHGWLPAYPGRPATSSGRCSTTRPGRATRSCAPAPARWATGRSRCRTLTAA